MHERNKQLSSEGALSLYPIHTPPPSNIKKGKKKKEGKEEGKEDDEGEKRERKEK